MKGSRSLPKLELMRSETFPFPERFATHVSPLGTISYFDTGPSAQTSPALAPVVLLHALGTNFTQWEHVAPALYRHTRVIGLDVPGCGHSERPRGPYRLSDLRETVCALLDHLGVERPVIVGHSFGGRIAMEVALAEPQRASGLVIINSAGLIRYPRVFEKLGKTLLRPSVVGTLLLGAAPLFLHRIFAKKSAESEHFMEQVFGRISPGFAFDFAHHFYPLLPDLISDVIDRLPELSLPVQVMWGERDEMLDFRRIEPVLHRIPDVTIERLPECGHMPNLEAPAVASAVITAFLERLARRKNGVKDGRASSAWTKTPRPFHPRSAD